ncbi:hypothetical protein E2C01_076335 [Portunus trituberculatus]|uniref:Uncharacterized protein n=1 Tax=Portunus trituberculatus TaxID=210409 RepID=A0A5B7IHF3_PORTR|nr:hypothetical protein [Portunus trituberculatus]
MQQWERDNYLPRKPLDKHEEQDSEQRNTHVVQMPHESEMTGALRLSTIKENRGWPWREHSPIACWWR